MRSCFAQVNTPCSAASCGGQFGAAMTRVSTIFSDIALAVSVVFCPDIRLGVRLCPVLEVPVMDLRIVGGPQTSRKR